MVDEMIAVSLQSLSCFVILMAFDCYYSITIQRPEQEEVLKEKIRAQAGGEHITVQNTCHNYLVFSSYKLYYLHTDAGTRMPASMPLPLQYADNNAHAR